MGESGWESNSAKPLDGSGWFYWKIGELVVFVQKWVEVNRFCWKMGRSVSLLSKNVWGWVFFLKNGWEWVVIVEIREGMRRFCRKMGGSGLLFLKDGWEWVTFLEKWWESIVFIEKWVGVGRCCRKISGSWLFFLKNGWEWVRVPGSGWECNSVKPLYWVSGFKRSWRLCKPNELIN